VALPASNIVESDIEAALRRLVAEFDADAEAAADGSVSWRFPELTKQIAAGADARRLARFDERRVGAVVYSSADDEIEAGRREIATYDRDLARSLESPTVAWLDEFEMAGLPTPVPEPDPLPRGRRRR
jgi:hypothetical protein